MGDRPSGTPCRVLDVLAQSHVVVVEVAVIHQEVDAVRGYVHDARANLAVEVGVADDAVIQADYLHDAGAGIPGSETAIDQAVDEQAIRCR